MRLHKTADLDPKGNYMFGYHPHGIIGVGAFITFATGRAGVHAPLVVVVVCRLV